MTDNPFVQCPTCGVRGLVLRNAFTRMSVADVRERFPDLAHHVAGMEPTRLVPVGRPELHCPSCGSTFDGTQSPRDPA